MQALLQRIKYERTFSLSERYRRAKEGIAIFIARHVLPKRVRMWCIYRAGADATTGQFGHVSPSDVKFFDLIDRMN